MNFSSNKEEQNSITRNNNKPWNKETQETSQSGLDITTKKKYKKNIKNQYTLNTT